MSRLVTIDPGVHHWGVAVWDEEEGNQPRVQLTYAQLVQKIEDLDDLCADKVVIEKPFTIGNRAFRGKTDSLIDLAVVVGRLYERFEAGGSEIVLLTENQWKGGVPKEVMHRRCRDKLASWEESRIELPKNKKRQLDVWDAVSIGIKVLKR